MLFNTVPLDILEGGPWCDNHSVKRSVELAVHPGGSNRDFDFSVIGVASAMMSPAVEKRSAKCSKRELQAAGACMTEKTSRFHSKIGPNVPRSPRADPSSTHQSGDHPVQKMHVPW